MTPLEKFLEHYRKFAVGLGAATAIAGVVLAIFDKLSTREKAELAAGIYAVCLIGALIWARIAESRYIRRRISADEAGQSSLVIKPEEHLAHVANKFARRFFGRARTITYEKYKAWRRLNPLIFTSVVGSERELLGFFDIFPLVDTAGKAVREGNMKEEEILMKDILPEQEAGKANYIYIATVLSCVANDLFQAKLLEFMVEFMKKYYPPRPGRFYLAFAATKDGAALLKRNCFILELDTELTTCRRDLFVLNEERARMAIDRVSGIRKVLQHRARRAQIPLSAQAAPA